MKFSSKKIIMLFLIIFFLSLFYFVGSRIIITKEKNRFINISELSEEFMTNYFKESEELIKEHNDNIILLVSKKDIKDVNAIKILKAPNNTYILQYEDEISKNEALKNFKNDKSVFGVIENRKYTFSENNNVKYNSWGVEKVGFDYINNIINNGDGYSSVVAAIIDTGCDMDLFNKSYDGKIVETYNLYQANVYGNDNVMFDHFGHGTHIAGTIAEATPNNVKILPVKVSDDRSVDTVNILHAINYITYNHKADVINMSFGAPYVNDYDYTNDPEYIAIEAAKEEGIISVAAAGNSNSSNYEYPAAFDNTISISAVDDNLDKAEFSSYGDRVTFAAPGVNIKSINGIKSGTSMATPHAVSAVAIVKSINKNISLEDTIEVLKNLAIDIGPKGKDIYYGYGFINFYNSEICEDSSTQSCDVGGVFKKIKPNSLEVINPKLTEYNYGSLNNILSTEIKITSVDGTSITKELWEIDADISNYDPYSKNEQTVNVKYDNLETSFKITNPTNYKSGWIYEENYSEPGTLKITGYLDHNLRIDKLYFPSKIEDKIVTSLADSNNGYSRIFGNSNDAKNYTEVYLPKEIEYVGAAEFVNFEKLYKFVSEADTLKVGGRAFADLKYLTSVVANLYPLSNASSVFSNNTLLQSVTLDDKVETIPIAMFQYCTNLKNIKLPSNIKTISEFAFSNTGIDEIIFPEGLEEIGSYAFQNLNLNKLNIPSTLVRINDFAFNNSDFNYITVSVENTKYDSRDDCNCIIETESNKLIKGSTNTVVPNTVKVIGSNSFTGASIRQITIPEGVEKIDDNAFNGCIYLGKIIIPKSVKSLGKNNFDFGFYAPSGNTIMYVYKDSFAYEYAESNGYAYYLINDEEKMLDIESIAFGFDPYLEYKAFEKFNMDGKIYIKYLDNENPEIITELKKIIYENAEDYFTVKDRSLIIVYDTNSGFVNLKAFFPVTIGLATPVYEVPTDIKGNIHQKLSDIDLPDNFEWMNGDLTLDDAGTKVFDAKYVPDDENYKTVENIAIAVEVVDKTLIEPTITIDDKVYDGTKEINENLIHIDGINKSEYEIINVSSNSENVGNMNATITLKLTDEKFLTHSFAGALQQKEFKINMNILPQPIKKPTIKNKDYVYNKKEQYLLFDNYNNKVMNIEGNKRIDAGEQDVVISLKNNNYIWEDNTREKLVYKFVIKKAEPDFYYYCDDTRVLYDSNYYGIDCYVSPKNYKDKITIYIKYMDENNNYILDESPKFKDIGEYLVKYKIYSDSNHEEVFSENKVIIGGLDKNSGLEIKDNILISKYNKLEEIKNNFKYFNDAEFELTDENSNVLQDELIKTNYILNIYSVTEYKTYKLSLLGDVNGDGKINSMDYVKIRKHIMQTENISNKVYYYAADINNDNKISSADYVKIKKYIMNGGTL